jgi:hypothetical protein
VSTDEKASAQASATSEGVDPNAPVETAPGAFRCGGQAGHQGDHPAYADTSCWENQLGNDGIALHGGLELDAGYAEYGFRDLPTTPLREFLDLRGRFVAGVHLTHDFGKSGYWVAAVGQMVAWAREREGNNYQINADDVYGQVGHTGGNFTNWDFQLGRFMTWRVFHKGLGFDLYTLEDCGAESQPGVCGVHTYEVNHIYLRNSPHPSTPWVCPLRVRRLGPSRRWSSCRTRWSCPRAAPRLQRAARCAMSCSRDQIRWA